MTADETYMAGRDASAAILADGYRAADQLHADVIDGAHETLKASRRNFADLAERDRAHGDASDARAYLYAEAEQRHQDRLAALALHFGQFYRGPGNPAADHALDFVATLDGEFAAIGPSSGAGRIVRERRVDANGRVMPEDHNGHVVSDGSPEQPRPDPERTTFTGDAAEFNRLKFAGTRTPSERADDERSRAIAFEGEASGSSVVRAKLVPDDRQSTDRRREPPPAYPTTEGHALRPDASEGRVDPTLGGIVVAEPKQAIPAPPAGLLADIAATLARTAR